MRRRSLLINSSGGGGTDPSQAAPLEVAFYNSTSDSIVIRKQSEWLDGETPIGIVVVPGYHDRYGDGSCGIMSLVGMDYNHPETGMPVTGASQTDDINIVWGHYGPNALVGNDIFLSSIALTYSNNNIPYQISNASTECGIDGINIVWPYAGTTTAPTSGASMDYSNDGGYVTATTGKAGCDFNGIRNTVALYVATRTDYQWTVSFVDNGVTSTNAPAAACAGRFKTVGTKSFLDVFSGTTSNNLNYGTSASPKENTGFWYLPGEGELCYLPRFRFEINKTISALNQKYGNVGVQLYTSYETRLYWSSSEADNARAWYVFMINGEVLYNSKAYYGYVRAFMRL